MTPGTECHRLRDARREAEAAPREKPRTRRGSTALPSEAERSSASVTSMPLPRWRRAGLASFDAYGPLTNDGRWTRAVSLSYSAPPPLSTRSEKAPTVPR